MRIERKNNELKRKIFKNIKIILFISMLILTYFLSTKTIDFLLTVDVETLKRSLNIILVVLVVGIYLKPQN